jgi:hypothetical protein
MSAQLVNLRLAFGPKSKAVDFSDLGRVSMPERTESYVPIRHDDLVSMVKLQMETAGLNIVQESHVLWRNGLRYFGLMQVQHPELESADQAMIVGLRNSLDKSLPACILSGGQVFLCDNLIMVGETVIGRKHTRFILDELDGLINKAMGTLFNHWNTHFNRIKMYKEFDLGNLQANDLIVGLYRLGAIGKTQVAEAIDQWYAPNYDEFKGRNLWNLHNSLTEILKGRVDLLPMSSKIIHSELDKLVGFQP